MPNWIKPIIVTISLVIGYFVPVRFLLYSQFNSDKCIVGEVTKATKNGESSEVLQAQNRCFLFVERMAIIISGSIILVSGTWVFANEMDKRRNAEQQRKKIKLELRKYELVLETYKKIIEQPVSNKNIDKLVKIIQKTDPNPELVKIIQNNVELNSQLLGQTIQNLNTQIEKIMDNSAMDNANTNENYARPRFMICSTFQHNVNQDIDSISDKINDLSDKIDRIESTLITMPEKIAEKITKKEASSNPPSPSMPDSEFGQSIREILSTLKLILCTMPEKISEKIVKQILEQPESQ